MLTPILRGWSIMILLLGSSLDSQGRVEHTTERFCLDIIASRMESYRTLNGVFPANWDQMMSIIDYDLFAGMRSKQGYTLRERYLFLNQLVPMPTDGSQSWIGGKVAAIRTVPLIGHGKDRGPTGMFRYVLYILEDGRVAVQMMSEAQVQKMLREAKLEVPRPPNAPEFESDDPEGILGGRGSSRFWFFAIAVLLGLGWFWLKRCSSAPKGASHTSLGF